MFPASSLQIIKDALLKCIADGFGDAEDQQEIADFCDTNIKAVCPECDGTGQEEGKVYCVTCRGTGHGPHFSALNDEMVEKNAKIQSKVKKKLKEKKHGKK